jgi:hypothetical protein
MENGLIECPICKGEGVDLDGFVCWKCKGHGQISINNIAKDSTNMNGNVDEKFTE